MNRIVRLTILILIAAPLLNSYSQPLDTENRKFIEVTGSAETLILPDEIELEVVLTEHNKQSIDQAEQNLYSVLEAHGIPKDAVQMQSQFNWWYWWSYYREAHPVRTLKIKIGQKADLMKLASDLRTGWVQSARVVNWTNKESQRIRREVKVEAIRAAKEKATYLLEAVGERTGAILSVTELPESQTNQWYHQQPIVSNSFLKSSYDANAAMEHAGEIKLRFEVKVKFEIK